MNKALFADALDKRSKLSCSFIGITGSNGKTTTKRMLRCILQEYKPTYEFGDDSDEPDSIATELLSLENKYAWALVKMGAISPDGIKLATRLIQPIVGIVTNVGEAHLARHGSTENIAKEKAQLIHQLKPGGLAVLNRDNDYTKTMAADSHLPKKYFGLSTFADYYASDIELKGPQGMTVLVHKKNGKNFRLVVPIYSLGDVYNCLAAVAITDSMGVPMECIVDGLEHKFILPDGRGRLHKSESIYLIDDTHDATPQSLLKSSKALLNFKSQAKRTILVLGDMTELGQQAENLQKMIGHYLSAMPIDCYVLVGEYAHVTAEAIRAINSSSKNVYEFEDMETCQEFLLNEIAAGDAIMVEGSEKHDMTKIVRTLCDRLELKAGHSQC